MEKIAFYAVDGLYHFYRATPEGKFGSSIKESDAELIVKAVNAFDEMKDSIEYLLMLAKNNPPPIETVLYRGHISDIELLLKHLESNPLKN